MADAGTTDALTLDVSTVVETAPAPSVAGPRPRRRRRRRIETRALIHQVALDPVETYVVYAGLDSYRENDLDPTWLDESAIRAIEVQIHTLTERIASRVTYGAVLELTPVEACLLVEAAESYGYWIGCEPEQRRDGAPIDGVEAAAAAVALAVRLRAGQDNDAPTK